MAIRLFRRRSRRIRSRASGDGGTSGTSGASGTSGPDAAPAVAGAAAANDIRDAPVRRRSTLKNQLNDRPTGKLHRRARTYSFDSGRSDVLDIDRVRGGSIAKRSGRRLARKPSNSPPRTSAAPFDSVASRGDPRILDSRNNGSTPSKGSGVAHFERVPTLHHPSKRDSHHLLQRSKSSKRRKNAGDREREAVVKAMSQNNFGPPAILNGNANGNGTGKGHDLTPLRPAVGSGRASRPVRHATFGDLNGKTPQLLADTLVPGADAIDSAMSSDSEALAFTVSPLDALAPKPTLRFASGTHYRPEHAANGWTMPQRKPSQSKRKLSEIPLTAATLKAHKRVDDLADDLTAGDLRELMERDKRRRERKRAHEQDRMERRLALQAEQELRDLERHQQQQHQQQHRQHQQQVHGSSSGSGTLALSSSNMLRGVMGRESAGLGHDTLTSAVVTSSVSRQSPPLPGGADSGSTATLRGTQAEQDRGDAQHQQSRESNHSLASAHSSNPASAGSSGRGPSPADLFHRPESIPLEPEGYQPPVASSAAAAAAAGKRRGSAAVPARVNSKLRKANKLQKRRSSPSSVTRPRSRSRSQTASAGTTTNNSSSRASLQWSSLSMLFRWGKRSKRSSGGISFFSNRSRDSDQSTRQRQQQQQQQQQHSQQLKQVQPPTQEQQPRARPQVEPQVQPQAQPQPQPQAQPLPQEQARQSQEQTTAAKPIPLALGSSLTAHGNTPRRTLSRFREDLSDGLISPPDSRMQSPEPVPAVPQALSKKEQKRPERLWTQFPLSDVDDDYDDNDSESIIATPTAFHGRPLLSAQSQPEDQHPATTSAMTASPGSAGNSLSSVSHGTSASWLQNEDAGNREPLSAGAPAPAAMSLASIDSEGSWLSGRVGPRNRARPSQAQKSPDSVAWSHSPQLQSATVAQTAFPMSSMPPVAHGTMSTAEFLSAASAAIAQSALPSMVDNEDVDMADMVADDEYFRRISVNPGRPVAAKHSAGDMRPSSDEEVISDNHSDDDNAHWGSVRERRVAKLVPIDRQATVKSRQGHLVKIAPDDEMTDVNSVIMAGASSPVGSIGDISLGDLAKDNHNQEGHEGQDEQDQDDREEREDSGMQRATSINLGAHGHVRHISAGSAKLLDLSPRNSVDAKARPRDSLILKLEEAE